MIIVEMAFCLFVLPWATPVVVKGLTIIYDLMGRPFEHRLNKKWELRQIEKKAVSVIKLPEFKIKKVEDQRQLWEEPYD
jgi:hypothetical protein